MRKRGKEGGGTAKPTERDTQLGSPSAMTWWPPLFLTPQILGYFDYAFTSIFTVEILLKV